ncbi:hypothetical protein [Rhizohabitans arisaemae]|uniref:hypothetical protein n=1 Tax=Rhizohabitans arisaemae TaxID=2720610 RepID=UPI0024B0C16E|nr:hypothetical protein [Rhizohabitans arisaemae]
MVRRALALAAAAVLAALAMFTATAPAQAAAPQSAVAASSSEDVLYSPLVAGAYCTARYGSTYYVGAYESWTFYCYSGSHPKIHAYDRQACEYLSPGRTVYFVRPGVGGALVCNLSV